MWSTRPRRAAPVVSPSPRRSPANPFGTGAPRRSGTDSRSRRICNAAQSRGSGWIASSLPSHGRNPADYATTGRRPVTEPFQRHRPGRTRRFGQRRWPSSNRFSRLKNWAGRKSVCVSNQGANRGHHRRVPACVATPRWISGRTVLLEHARSRRIAAGLPKTLRLELCRGAHLWWFRFSGCASST